MSNYNELKLKNYKHLVALDIVAVTCTANVRILYYYVSKILIYFLLEEYTKLGYENTIEAPLLRDLVKLKYFKNINANDKMPIAQAASILESTILHPETITPLDLVLLQSLVYYCHTLMNAHNIREYNEEKHVMIGGAIYHGNLVTFDCLCLDKEC